MKKTLIFLIVLLTGCLSAPVRDLTDTQLMTEYNHLQYRVANIQGFLSSPRPNRRADPEIIGYQTTGQIYNLNSGNNAYYNMNTTPVYDYSAQNAAGIANATDSAARLTNQIKLRRIFKRLSEIEVEMSKRGVLP